MRRIAKCDNCGCFYSTLKYNTCPFCSETKSEQDSITDKEGCSLEISGRNELQNGVLVKSRYCIEGFVRNDEFSNVYKVKDLLDESYKLLKEYFPLEGFRLKGEVSVYCRYPKREAEFEFAKKNFLKTAQIIGRCKSKALMRVKDFFEENNTSYMVTEFIDMQSIEEIILKNKKILEPQQVIDVALDICEALEEVHKKGVIHRWIGPDSVFVDEDGNVKIDDFGMANLGEGFDKRFFAIVKPGFAAPEQYGDFAISKEKQREWTDIYAVGALLYTILSGNVPTEAIDRNMQLENLSISLSYPELQCEGIVEAINKVIIKAMDLDMRERFQNASDLAEVLWKIKNKMCDEKNGLKKRGIRRFL